MLQKQAIPINFSQGLDLKTDPWQVSPGKFLSLENTIFTKGGLLQKRNGYSALPSLPESANYVTTFNGDLTAIGTELQALSAGYGSWVDRGYIQPLSLSVLPLIRNNLNQTQADTAVASNGLVYTVYSELDNTTTTYKYVVADSVTGQNIIEPTIITSANATYGTPRVFLLGQYFIVLYTGEVSSTYNLQYIAVSTVNPNNVFGPTIITTNYTPSSRLSFDGIVFNNSLYIAWGSPSGVNMLFLTKQLILSSTTNPDVVNTATIMSLTADYINSVIWASYYNSGTNTGHTFAVSPILSPILSPQLIIAITGVVNITSSAQNGLNTILYENANSYAYDTSIPTNYVKYLTCTQTGTVGSSQSILRSVGLASKSFIINEVIYAMFSYASPYQPTYFVSNIGGNIIAKLAYENGAGYLTVGLPEVTVNGQEFQIPYLFKDLISAVNKNTNVPSGTQVDGIYSQLGINLASFTLGTNPISAEIGTNLNITGGFTWAYDGYSVTEQGFFLWPDSIELLPTNSGSMSEQQYYYQVTYEWTDNQGNAFRSAPSIPVSITLTSGQTAVEINIPTLRLTYKISNPIKIVIYRWSVAQQIYYQVTSIIAPILNNTSIDYVTYIDTSSDATILGNNIIYTNGGVIEDIGPPSFSSMFLFDDRLWGITSEDPNLLWFSKQVIESTPVEMSDLLTMYIAPSLGVQGPSGNLICGFPMDDKLVLLKARSMSYVNGTGPDNVGANSQYSPPILITSTIGCSNQASIVFMPNGLMFEFTSESGNQIWLLSRDLQTQYIGAPVESLTTNATVQSAVNIPGTNQVRFTMSSGITLMYDYYYGQWGSFVGVPAISSTLYQGLHTYINGLGMVYQESPGKYLDGSNPTLINFTTSWLNMAGLQGYQRAYFFYILGKYITPHKLQVTIAYDYNSSPSQSSLITPDNFNSSVLSPFGVPSAPFGANVDIEQWRVFLTRQRCQSFQIGIQEIYDPSFGAPAGEGLTISGLNVIVGLKSKFRPQPSSTSIGGYVR